MSIRGLPLDLYRLGRRVVRPRDAEGLYRNPRAEFRRLADAGALRRVAHGYYLIPRRRRWATRAGGRRLRISRWGSRWPTTASGRP
ncbi:hypothetical protein ER308_15080 [Egibacter rhizosphaerae]|uniref:AbiEi antitoxin N-terminal domain-containing protein n=1 Tax=Egibacter rhizosphaerae TaxID=1670831 RepID=A0A411YHL0_9ACTN|nr:hypothetical protein ER308_15080 [Egibacter rhizosphaerae]